MSKKIAMRLVELRGKTSQAEIAKIAGVRSATTISNWENWDSPEHSTPSAEAIARLAEHWDVSADYIVGRSEYRSGLAPDSFLVDKEIADALLAGEPRKKVAARLGNGLAAKIPRQAMVLDYRRYQDLKRRIAIAQGEKHDGDPQHTGQ